YAVGFNLIFGSTGQLFLCVGALAGVGGYGTALLADRAGVPLVAALIISTLGAALVGGLLSWVAVRRSLGVIFAGIITLIFALSFENLVLGASTLTGGDAGIQVSAGSGTFLRQRSAAPPSDGAVLRDGGAGRAGHRGHRAAPPLPRRVARPGVARRRGGRRTGGRRGGPLPRLGGPRRMGDAGPGRSHLRPHRRTGES